MKEFLTLLLMMFALGTIPTQAQEIKNLHEVSSNSSVSSNEAIIYGNFIQRLGFTSGGFPQDIRIIDMATREIFAFRVKPAFTSSKENTFAYFLRPGTYAILNYWWTQSKWYGGVTYIEPIYKGVDTSKNGTLNNEQANNLWQFIFTVKGGTINYVGTWHFEKGLVSFQDDKLTFDEKTKGGYNLDFSIAQTVLPK